MSLQIQSKFELMLMVYNDTFENQMQGEMPNENLAQRAEDLVMYYKELQNAIDELPDFDDSDPKTKLKEYHAEKDNLIDTHNQIKGKFVKMSEELDKKIKEFITKPKN